MERTMVYKTNDGKLFEIEGDAIRHEEGLKALTDLKKFVKLEWCSGMDCDDIIKMLTDNKDEVVSLLSKLK